MKKVDWKVKEIKAMASVLNVDVKKISAIQKMNDESKMTATLYIVHTSEAPILNICDCVTFIFDTVDELDNYIAEKFEIFTSDKEMWQAFTGMDDETWEEWNK